jgi:hypothetical protein
MNGKSASCTQAKHCLSACRERERENIPSPVKQSPILREVPVILHQEPATFAESPPPIKNDSPPL